MSSYSTGIRLYSDFCSTCWPFTIPDGSGNLAPELQATRYAGWNATKGSCSGTRQNAPYRMPSGIIQGIRINALIPHQRKEDLQVSLVRGFGGAHGPSGGWGAWHWPWVEKEVPIWNANLNANQAISQSGGPVSYNIINGITGVAFGTNVTVNIPDNKNILLNNPQEVVFSGVIPQGTAITASLFNPTLSGTIQGMTVSADIFHRDPSQLRVSIISPQKQIRRIWNATTTGTPPSAPSTPLNSGSFYYTGGARIIPDKLFNGPRAAAAGTTALLQANVPKDYKISSLRVSASITHENTNDVRLTLTSPDGRRTFVKKESNPNESSPATGRFWSVSMSGVPEFNGRMASGIWRLLAQDLPAYAGKTGTLDSFAIHMVSTGAGAALTSGNIPTGDTIYTSPITNVTLSGTDTSYVLNWTGVTHGFTTPYRIYTIPPVPIADGYTNWTASVPLSQPTGRHANWFGYDYYVSPSFSVSDTRQTGIINEPVTLDLNITHENLNDLRIYLNNMSNYPTNSPFPKDSFGRGMITVLVTGTPIIPSVNPQRSLAIAHSPGEMRFPYFAPQGIWKSGEYAGNPPTMLSRALNNPGRISGNIEIGMAIQFGGGVWPRNIAVENSGNDYIQDLVITMIDPTGKRVNIHSGQSLAYYNGLNTPTARTRVAGTVGDGCWESLYFSGYKVTGFHGSRISGTWRMEIINKRAKYQGAVYMGAADGVYSLWDPSMFLHYFQTTPPQAVPAAYSSQTDPGILNYNMIRPWSSPGGGTDYGWRMRYSGDFGPDVKTSGTRQIQAIFPTQFTGARHNSVWSIRVEDLYVGNTGLLNSWSVRVGNQNITSGTPTTSGLITGISIKNYPVNFNGYNATGVWTLLVEDLAANNSGYVRGFTGQANVTSRQLIPVSGSGGTLILSGLLVNGFNNENSYGFWGLRVRDMVQGGTGHIHSWNMSITGRDFRVIHSGHVALNDEWSFVPENSKQIGGGTCGLHHLYP